MAFDPPIVTGTIARGDDTRVPFTVNDLTGTGGRYRLLMQREDGSYAPLGEAFHLDAGGSHTARVTIPRGPEKGADTYRARILVVPDGGQVAAGSAIVWASTAVATPDRALGRPRVDSTGSGIGMVTLRVGMRDVQGDGLVAATLHDVRMSLLPAGGGDAIRMTGAEPSGDWPAATYHVRLSQRDAKGTEVPAGRYRLVVTAKGPDGAVLSTRSGIFSVG